MMTFWIYQNHVCELRSEELNEGWLSQLYTQLLQLQKESLKLSFRSCKSLVYNCDDQPSFKSSLC